PMYQNGVTRSNTNPESTGYGRRPGEDVNKALQRFILENKNRVDQLGLPTEFSSKQDIMDFQSKDAEMNLELYTEAFNSGRLGINYKSPKVR
ncbi:hypothetical protein ACI3PL_21855, partial [Lacticaseibacillus paracasei]